VLYRTALAAQPAALERVRSEDDPRNPGYPTGWLRHRFPFMNVSYPGLKHLALAPGKALQLDYKNTITSPDAH